MVLVDTSVWIEVIRRHSTLRLEDVVSFDEIVTCLPVIQEVLHGFDDERAHRVARDAMFALPIVDDPLPRDALPPGAAGRADHPVGCRLPHRIVRASARSRGTASRP